MPGKTSNNEQGKLIQLFRTGSDDSTLLNSTTLEYGEPLYNEADGTLTIGQSTQQSTTSLPVFKQIPRNYKDNLVFGVDRNAVNEFVDLKNQNADVVYIKKKFWGSYDIVSNQITWYNVGSDGKKGNTVISDTTTYPRCMEISVPGMTSDLRPDLDLKPSTQARTNVARMKQEMKSFAAIAKGSYTDTDKIVLIFIAPLTVSFTVTLTSG